MTKTEQTEERTYKFRNTGGLLGKKAKVYGAELARIQQENGGILTPVEVVSEARNPKSVLHNCFEWDNSEAAEQYRLYQARKLISSINLVISYNGKQNEIDAFCNVTLPSQDNDSGHNQIYVDVHTAMGNESFRNEMIMKAMNELDYWREKYQKFREFGAVFVAIRQVQRKIKKKKD